MPLAHRFAYLSVFLLLISCTTTDPVQEASDRLTTTTWEFALENNPAEFHHQSFFGPGHKLKIKGDSVRINNGFLNREHSYPVQGKVSTDATISVGYKPTPLGGLKVSKYENDSLVRTAIFYPETGVKKVPHEQLSGKTYRVTNAEGETFRVYFGEDPKLLSPWPTTSYFVAGNLRAEQHKSYLSEGISYGSHNDDYAPRPLFESYYLRSSTPILSRKSTSIIRTPEGKLLVSSIAAGKDRYEEERFVMEQLPSIIPEAIDMTAFTDLLNYGKLTIDNSYPAPDSARVSYAYAEDFARFGLSSEELPDLEFNYSPLDGSYHTFVNRRKVAEGQWMLSPDRNNLIHLNQQGFHREVLPILAYSDTSITFRLPLLIQTREPRGVKLTSYASVDALIAVEKLPRVTK